LKPITGTLLALVVAASVTGCAKKEEPAAAADAAAPAATTPTMPPGEAHPAPAPAQEVDLTGIAKAEGGKTVAEVFAEKDQLAGKPVTFRGKVVKTNADIMGKNWLHVRDGSGAEGTNDLTVTTAGAIPNVGDTVVVTGPVVLNKDFGMGYTYEVLIEDAQVTVEPPSGT
jgi:hypothetical protein